MIELAEPLTGPNIATIPFNNFIDDQSLVDEHVRIMGWGSNITRWSPQVDHLQEFMVRVDALKKDSLSLSQESGRASCSGDSGGMSY